VFCKYMHGDIGDWQMPKPAVKEYTVNDQNQLDDLWADFLNGEY
jgi:hypothetical protein